MDMIERGLSSEEQKTMRASCRAFVDDFVTPRFEIVKAMFPRSAGAYAGPEN
jgi:hypothetical protein